MTGYQYVRQGYLPNFHENPTVMYL